MGRFVGIRHEVDGLDQAVSCLDGEDRRKAEQELSYHGQRRIRHRSLSSELPDGVLESHAHHESTM